MSTTSSASQGILFGASSSALLGVSELSRRGVQIIEVWDNAEEKQGTTFAGLPVQRPRHTRETVFIGSSYAKSIAEQLTALGCNYRYVAPFVDYSQYERYFSPIAPEIVTQLELLFPDVASRLVLEGLVKFRTTGDPLHLYLSDHRIYQHPDAVISKDAIVVDGGAWEGDTADLFKGLVGARGQIICVEPNPDAAALIMSDVRVRVVNSGLWNVDCRGMLDRISLERGGESGGFRVIPIPTDSSSSVELVRLDSLRLGRVDAIKLDIEGAEREAIEGAREVIRRDRPLLMVCLYHRWDDLWEIPKLIASIAPYKFYLGQHTESAVETVLYATPI